MVNPSLGITPNKAIALPGFFGRYDEFVSRSLKLAFPQSEMNDLYNMLQYHMGWVDKEGTLSDSSKGKALRPVLCLLACQSVGGAIEQALPAAAALEFIHNFSLIHDDIQDGDKERRGRPTLWWIWGQPKALVSGNALKILADKASWGLLQEGVSCSKAIEASQILVQSYMEMIEGQYLDISYEKSLDITVNDYILLISLKTGALIRCAMELGAFIGSDEPKMRQAFRECGELLGATFQIRDDYLGIWGEEEVTGKAVGADILRKKKSFPVVYALENAKGKDRDRLLDIYSKNALDGSDVESVLEIMENVGAREHSEKLAQDRCKQAMQVIEEAQLPPQAQREFNDLADFMLARKH